MFHWRRANSRFAYYLIITFIFAATLKRPSHVKLMLANSCWQSQTGVCERHNNMLANCWRKIELVSILANSLPTCCYVHTHQREFANTSWPKLV